jgi:hypothetical protein
MKKILVFSFATLLAFSCGSQHNNKQISVDANSKKDSLRADSITHIPVHPPINRDLNDMARYIAGMEIAPGSKLDSSLLNNKDWKSYAKSLNSEWAKLDSVHLKVMKRWVEAELSDLHTKALFYPFAGADMLNAYTLFPNAKNYYMVGLEPVGTPPDFNKINKAKDLQHYFSTVHQSLSSIINFSFFRTKSMAVEFHQSDVNGTLHVLLLFLERTGSSIINIQPVAVNGKGELTKYASFADAGKDTLKNKGAEIDFISADSTEHTVIYFSINLSNEAFPKNAGFKAFIKNQGADVTYIKSASYLMHKAYFSDIRSTILAGSRAILQDDSGIPWKLFNDSTRNITLYGAYTGTIDIFPRDFQKDLDDAYKKEPSKSKVKDLPFGIGYKYIKGQSNLMLSVRKN